MNAQQIADELGVNERTVRRAIEAGRLPASRQSSRRFEIELANAIVALKGPYAAALHEALETLREVGFAADADAIENRYGLSPSGKERGE